MKKLYCTISIILCLSVILCVFPVCATEGNFVTLRILQNDDGKKRTVNDVAYKKGDYLYVSTDFLTAYVPYVFDKETSSFYRLNHELKSKYGTVTINGEQKTATLYMNPFSYKEYTLRDIYKFGDQLFLPLDQLAALLKAEVFEEIDDNGEEAISIACCINSLCDAEYALSKIMKQKYVYYGYTEMIDDIFCGDEKIFYYASVTSYFSSTFFDKRFTNLDIVFNSGDYICYKDILTKCVTDNKDCYPKMATSEPLLYRLNLIMELNSMANTGASLNKKFFSYIEKVTDTYAEHSPGAADTYFFARDHAALFSAISDVTEAVDYVLKFASMSQDNKDMLNNYAKYMSSNIKEYDPLNSAVKRIRDKYGDNFVTSIIKDAVERVFETYFKNKGTSKAIKEAIIADASKALGGNVALVSIAIDVISVVCKAAGIDLTDNTNYSVMKYMEVKSSLNNYVDSLGDRHYNKKADAERYRLAVIFWLLSSKHTFSEANKLGKKYGLSGNYYNDRIDVVSYVLCLFYLSSQGVAFDSFEKLESIINKNGDVIKNSEKICGDKISQDDALDCKYTNDSQSAAWKVAAEDAIYNYYEINPNMQYNDVFNFHLLDIDDDGIPEIFQGVAGGTAEPFITDFLYWNGSKFVLGDMGQINKTVYDDLIAYENTQTSETEFWNNALPDDYSMPCYKPWKYDTFTRISVKNGKLYFSETIDRSKYTDILSDTEDTYSEEEKNAAYQKMMTEKGIFEKQHIRCNPFYVNEFFDTDVFIEDGKSIDSYHKIVSKDDAKKIVEDYYSCTLFEF